MDKAKPEELIRALEGRITELTELTHKQLYALDKRITKMENRETSILRLLQDMVNLLVKK